MDSELVSDSMSSEGSESDDSSPLISFTEQFYDHLPFYLSIGMTFNQFWNEDCCLVKYYRKAYELQRERKNQELWLQGMYIYEAIGDMSPVLKAFAKKNTKPLKYPSEPYAITQQEIEKRKQAKERAAYERMKAKTNSFAIKFNANYQRKEE